MNPESRDAPQRAPSTQEIVQQQPAPEFFGSSPAAVLLRNFLRAAGTGGAGAERSYDTALENLRKHAPDVVVEIARAERACASQDYPTRWMLIFAASQLEHPAALSFLRTVATSPIPPERSKDPHSWSTVAEETILRTTAIDGVARLARRKNPSALASLFEFLTQPSFSIKRAAAHGILAAPNGRKHSSRIADLLPSDQRFILDMKHVDVRKVPQVKDPRKHLPERVRNRESVPKPVPKPAASRGAGPKLQPQSKKETK